MNFEEVMGIREVGSDRIRSVGTNFLESSQRLGQDVTVSIGSITMTPGFI